MFRLWLFFVILQFLLSVGVVFAKDIKSYSEIPEDANPNYEVLEHYLKKYISYSDIKNRPYKFTITPNNPKELILDLTTDEYVIKHGNGTLHKRKVHIAHALPLCNKNNHLQNEDVIQH